MLYMELPFVILSIKRERKKQKCLFLFKYIGYNDIMMRDKNDNV